MLNKEKYLTAEKHLTKAYNAQLNGKLNVAINEYKNSIDAYPTSQAHTFLGWAYSLQGKYKEAINECKKAIKLNPDFGNPYNDIGTYLIRLNRYNEAIIWLQKAIAAKDYEPRHYPYYNLGRVYEKRGEWLTALHYYNDSLKLNQDYELAQIAMIRLTTLLN